MWCKVEERGRDSWKSNANNNERNERKRERAVWSPYSLLRIIACRLAEADRGSERRTSAEPQWRHCGSTVLPVYRHSVCVSRLHGNCQCINTREVRGKKRAREREHRKGKKNKDRPVKVKWIHSEPLYWLFSAGLRHAGLFLDLMTKFCAGFQGHGPGWMRFWKVMT